MEYKALPEVICESLLVELLQSIPELLQTAVPQGFTESPLTPKQSGG